MFRVETYLDRSTIHGIGVFAGQDIASGQLVWEYNRAVDLVYTPAQWEALRRGIAPQSFKALRNYSYKEGGNIWLCLDNAQFMNHDRVRYNVENCKESNTMTARCPISRGSELVCDYFAFSDPDDFHLRQLPR